MTFEETTRVPHSSDLKIVTEPVDHAIGRDDELPEVTIIKLGNNSSDSWKTRSLSQSVLDLSYQSFRSILVVLSDVRYQLLDVRASVLTPPNPHEGSPLS